MIFQLVQKFHCPHNVHKHPQNVAVLQHVGCEGGETGLIMPLIGTTHGDLVHVSWLRIPQSFVEGLPQSLQPDLCKCVAYHLYHLILPVTSLRGKLPMPPPPRDC